MLIQLFLLSEIAYLVISQHRLFFFKYIFWQTTENGPLIKFIIKTIMQILSEKETLKTMQASSD